MRRKIDLIILLLVLIAGVFAVTNAQAIGDFVHAMRYDPPSEIVKLADDAGMSDEGKKLFYRFSPQLVDQATLDQKCDVEKLGCSEGQSIYILQYKDAAEYNRAIVTAAHEMLHVAYSRLNEKEVQILEGQLKTELSGYGAAGIADKLTDYPKEDYYNEGEAPIAIVKERVSKLGAADHLWKRIPFVGEQPFVLVYAFDFCEPLTNRVIGALTKQKLFNGMYRLDISEELAPKGEWCLFVAAGAALNGLG